MKHRFGWSPTLHFTQWNVVHLPHCPHLLCALCSSIICPVLSNLMSFCTWARSRGLTPLGFSMLGEVRIESTIRLVNSNRFVLLFSCLHKIHIFTTAPFRQNLINGQYHFFDLIRMQCKLHRLVYTSHVAIIFLHKKRL